MNRKMPAFVCAMLAASALAAGAKTVDFPIPDEVRSWDIPERTTNGVKAVWIENVPWRGKSTRFFAYYSLPDGATAEKKVPGIVLVHGGHGTAFHTWVKLWNDRGYAAIAMDNCGGIPGAKSHTPEHPRHEWSGPNGWGRFEDEALPPEEQWVYHAVECVIRSHTFLRNIPEVDASKIGVTGISWGGFLTSIVCGADPRFAFAAPVYGCGNLRRHSVFAPSIGERWESLWNPVEYAKRCRIPTLWCNGTNDYFFPLDSFEETAVAAGKPLFSIRLRMPHGHPPDGDPPEIAAFADSVVKGARKLADRKVVRREWLYTESTNPVWKDRHFEVSAEKPEKWTICVENAITDDGLILSSPPEFQLAAGIRLGAPFADGAVLQRGMKVPVWGKVVLDKEAQHDSGAVSGSVKVEFAGQTKIADVGKDGTWRVYLDPMEASKESRTMTVSVVAPDGSSDSKGESVEVRDVLVGEVWLASGQSNMECPIWGSCARYRDMKGGFMTAMTRLPNVRYVKCERKWSAEPLELSATWRKFTPEGLLHFNQIATHVGGGDSEEISLSAVAFYYARELYLALDVPIGIVDVSWGGSNIDAWIPKCGYDGAPASLQKPQTPGMYNGMVAAFAPMAVRGMIWYQGCTNWFKKEGDVYCDKLHALYNGWSREFANKDLKIYLAQLAPWEQNWMEICMAQTKFCAEEKNAALAVLADVGNFRDIHPNDKEIVAKRLVLHALKRDYGFDIPEDDSPVLKSISFGGGKARLAFDHVKDWYVYAPDHSRAPAFELAGEDGVWHSATILNYRKRRDSEGKEKGTDFIDGPEIVLSSAEVANPIKVRYMGKPLTSGTLYNEASLPLGPFELTSGRDSSASAK